MEAGRYILSKRKWNFVDAEADEWSSKVRKSFLQELVWICGWSFADSLAVIVMVVSALSSFILNC